MATTRLSKSKKQLNLQAPELDLDLIRSAQIRLIVGHLIEQSSNVHWTELSGPRRGSPHAKRARKIAMYLVHVGGGLTLTATGDLFERDRRTVAHAAAAVEDDREADQVLDRALDNMERAVRLTLARVQIDA